MKEKRNQQYKMFHVEQNRVGQAVACPFFMP